MVRKEFGHIEDLTVNDDPDIVLLVVLGDLCKSVTAGGVFASRSSRGGVGGRSWSGTRNMTSDGTETTTGFLHGSGSSLKEVSRGAVTGYTTENDAAEEGGTTKTISTMDTSCDLSRSKQARNRFSGLINDARLSVNLETTHSVVEDRGHDSDVEEIVKLPLALEELDKKWTSDRAVMTTKRKNAYLLAEGVLLGAD
jgi:hypothetical protein